MPDAKSELEPLAQKPEFFYFHAGNPKTMEPLAEALKTVRLEHYSDSELTELLAHAEPKVRGLAVEALAQRRLPDSIPSICAMQDDDAPLFTYRFDDFTLTETVATFACKSSNV